MSFLLFLAAAAAPAPPSTLHFTPRAMWRLCTRESVIAQLKARKHSLEAEPVIQKAFDDCASELQSVARTQSPDDIKRIQEEQRAIIQRDVEMFYWDNVTGHI